MADAAMQPDDRSERAGHGEHDHPGPMTYVVVAAVLTVLTALEVAVFYIPALRPAIVPILLTLTSGKFALVVMFYMHLKMDSRIFTWVFLAPLALAMFLVIGLIVLFRVLPTYFG
ncbi:MAG TPA: cytochrome C oxidase subunit IV family protein [Longimicrobiales bacterium]|nr:cytochrome C oxidase subunit IV family protein [Longimicrobiales bacterium]